MKYKIYLDDVRVPIENDWIVCRDYYEFMERIGEIGIENIEEISLDHDLGESAMDEYYRNVATNNILNYNNIDEKTGYDCAKWLVELSMDSCIPLPLIYVHSANPIGSLNIINYINGYLRYQKLPESCTKRLVKFTC